MEMGRASHLITTLVTCLGVRRYHTYTRAPTAPVGIATRPTNRSRKGQDCVVIPGGLLAKGAGSTCGCSATEVPRPTIH